MWALALCVWASGCASGGGMAGPSAPPPPSEPASAGGTTSAPPPASHHAPPKRVRGVPAVDMPRRSLTPGGALPVGLTQICRAGYASATRDVSESEKDAVYARYGVAHLPGRREVDHLVSLEIGGSNAITNLWPEPYAGRWGARTKDVLENRLHELVCDHRLALRAAQHIEAVNWVAAYRRLVGASTPAAPRVTPVGSPSAATTPSSYGTASTIYCADDPSWRDLSRRYLVHLHTWAAAHRRFPSYHLHRPC